MFTLNQLEVFRCVAEAGSFNKAADELFVTPNAVLKQINNLEKEVGVALFSRSFRGQTLTQAGEVMYEKAVQILKMSNETIKEVREVADKDQNRVRVGASVMTPLEPFKVLWNKISKEHPEIKFEVVTFDNIPTASNGVVSPIPGTKIDILVDTFDKRSLEIRDSEGLELTRVSMYAMLSINHRFADRESIDIEDLAGETLVYRKDSMDFIDNFCEHIKEAGVPVYHKIIPSYSIEVYNETAESEDIILGVGDFKTVHPFLKRIPINWDQKCPFGLLYSKTPSPATKRLIDIVRKIVDQEAGKEECCKVE